MTRRCIIFSLTTRQTVCTLERLTLGFSRPFVPTGREVPFVEGMITRPISATLLRRHKVCRGKKKRTEKYRAAKIPRRQYSWRDTVLQTKKNRTLAYIHPHTDRTDRQKHETRTHMVLMTKFTRHLLDKRTTNTAPLTSEKPRLQIDLAVLFNRSDGLQTNSVRGAGHLFC